MLILLTLFWFVQFTNKLDSTPSLSERAIENRLKWNIPTDSLDYPVAAAYLDSIRAKGAKVCYVSRWFNGCEVEADAAVVAQIQALPFVLQIEPTRTNAKSSGVSQRKFPSPLTFPLTLTMPLTNTPQLQAYNLLALHDLGYEGQGIRVAVIDNGFHKVHTAPCFDSVRSRILGAWDFSGESTSIYGSDGQHGANCLSFLAAVTPTYHGAATQAEYVLIRTEENLTESPKECDNLVAAYELCDSLGVDIITCSLGYFHFDNSEFNFTYTMMDGRTTRVSRAAAIAARKGMLLCQSAGNEGNKSWHYICAPSDADSILTVGALGLDSAMAAFSSYGPSADGRVKPEVSAVGFQAVYWNTDTNSAAAGNGTSYSTPLLAGLAASLWSALPDASAQEIRERIIRSAHLYPNYDNRNQMGYGIPDAWQAYQSSPTALPVNQFTDSPTPRFTKFLRSSHLYIIYDGVIYDGTGNRWCSIP